jgi:hypothetical protein
MLKPKSAQAPQSAKRTRRFSLVSDEAQQQMYGALQRLNRAGARDSQATGAEVAEIALCLAAGESSPLILASSARGARLVGRPSRVVKGGGQRLTDATLAAVDVLLRHAEEPTEIDSQDSHAESTRSRGKKSRKHAPAYPVEAAAIVCAGRLDATPEARRDYRAAFAFAARHKLPILYLVANQLAPEQSQSLDLRTLYAEFGMPLFTVDAADAVAAFRVATEALHNARHLRGPCVVEALTLPAKLAGADHEPIALLTAYMERHGNPPR